VAQGKPLMRALFLEVENDEQIWNFPEEYFLGNDLLVAPITAAGRTKLPVYLPSGEWIDPWTGDRFSGPLVVERHAGLDTIPVFVRAGSAPSLVECFVGLDDRTTE
jgi:alpha-glucosidase (family GH31 glycosyl hydrolase)